MKRISREFSIVDEDEEYVVLYSNLTSDYYKVRKKIFVKIPSGDIQFDLLKSKISIGEIRHS